MFQKNSALARWFRQRTENAPRTRKTMIVALARKGEPQLVDVVLVELLPLVPPLSATCVPVVCIEVVPDDLLSHAQGQRHVMQVGER